MSAFRLPPASWPQTFGQTNYFAKVKQLSSISAINQLLFEILQRPNKEELLSKENNKKKTLLAKIIRRATKVQASSPPNPFDLDKFCKLLKSAPKPLSSHTGAPNTTLDISVDLLDYQLEYLEQHLEVKKLKRKYSQILALWEPGAPLPAELSALSSQEIFFLTRFSSYESRTPLVNGLNQLTDDFLNNENQAQLDAHMLLEKAIRKRCPRVVKYLLSLGINVYDPVRGINYISIAMENSVEGTKAEQLNILEALYKKRNPLSVQGFYEIILQTMQSYLPPTSDGNQMANQALLDRVLTSLLGAPIDVRQYLLGDTSKKIEGNRARYIAHLFHLAEKKWAQNSNQSGPDLIGDSLEGYYPHEYFPLHLRLFLQDIIESVQSKNEIHLKEKIDEFLCQLETGWLLIQHSQWLDSTNDLEMKEKFIQKILVEYVLRQIKNTPSKSEYVIYVGLPLHSIYIAFCNNAGELEVRVDNLGGFSEDPNSRQLLPRHISNTKVEDPNLRGYFELLFKTTQECYKRSFNGQHWALGYPMAKKIYNVNGCSRLPQPTSPKGYPAFPLQKVGNCTYYSFLIGQCIRMPEESRDFPFALAVLAQKNTSLCERKSLPTSNKTSVPVSYPTLLRRRLLLRYMAIECNAAPRRHMTGDLLKQEKILNALLSSKSMKCRISIKGSAGIGKTIFSQQLAFQLQSCQKLNSVILYLPLRKLLRYKKENGYQLINIVEKLILDRPIPIYEKPFLEAIIEDPSTVWVLDGLDELITGPELNNTLKELFSRQKLIVTSRPHFSSEKLKGIVDLEESTWKQMFQIDEYTFEEQEKVIDYYFNYAVKQKISGLENPKERLKNLLKLPISSKDQHPNPHLKKMCGIPISLVKICQLLTEGRTEILGETNIAVINEKFISFLIANAYGRKEDTPTKSTDFIRRQYPKEIKALEELAFKSLEEKRETHFSLAIKNQALPYEDLDEKEEVINNLHDFGLIQLDEGGGQFIHATYQEHLAACYILKAFGTTPFSPEYDQAEAFVERHRNAAEYDYVFLCIAQMLKDKIFSEGKRQGEYLSILKSILEVYFRENDISTSLESMSLSEGSSRKRGYSISFISIIYKLIEEVREPATKKIGKLIDEIRVVIKERVFPVLRETLENTRFTSWNSYEELQGLMLDCPGLKERLGCSDIVLSALEKCEASTQNQPVGRNVDWILEFIGRFHVSMDPGFFIRLSRFSRQVNKLNLYVFNILKAISHEVLENDGTPRPLSNEVIEEICSLIKIGLSSSQISNNYSIIRDIHDKIRPQLDLTTIVAETASELVGHNSLRNNSNIHYNSPLFNFVGFLNHQKPYTFVSDETIQLLVNSKEQRIIPELTSYLCHYSAYLFQKRDEAQLGKVVEYFKVLFGNYRSNSSNMGTKGSRQHKELLDLKNFVSQDLSMKRFFDDIFSSWDQIVVVKHLSSIIENEEIEYNIINAVVAFINDPPQITSFYFPSNLPSAMANGIVEISPSVQYSAKGGSNYRPDTWEAIGRYLGNKRVVDCSDSVNFQFVDRIVEEVLSSVVYMKEHNWTTKYGIKIHGNSNLYSEMRGAIFSYKRRGEHRSFYDQMRIDRIQHRYQEYSHIPQLPMPTKGVVPRQHTKPLLQKPSDPLQTKVLHSTDQKDIQLDLSYNVFLETLGQLKPLFLKNPHWASEFLSPSKKAELKMELIELRETLFRESKESKTVKYEDEIGNINEILQKIVISSLIDEYSEVAVALVLCSKLKEQEEVVRVAVEEQMNILPQDIKSELEKLYGGNLHNQLVKIAEDIYKIQKMVSFGRKEKTQKIDTTQEEVRVIGNSGKGLQCGYYAMSAGILQLPVSERTRIFNIIDFRGQLKGDITVDQYAIGDQLFRYSIKQCNLFKKPLDIFINSMISEFNRQQGIDTTGQYDIVQLNQEIDNIRATIETDRNIYADRIQILGNHLSINCYINDGLYGAEERENAPRIDIYNRLGGHYVAGVAEDRRQ